MPDIPLTVRASARARRITLRVSQLDGRVTITRPRGVTEREALAFAAEKEAWIRKHLAARVAPVEVGLGVVLPVEGVDHEVVAGSGRSVRCEAGRLAVPGDAVGRRLQAYLRTRARDRLAAACDLYAERLGREYSGLTLRDTRSRWGSCSSAGRLMFSWRLILSPPEVLDYVAAHEVAHLAQMNHSPAFWSEVERIHGPYVAQRGWLRSNGSALHRYRFDN